MAKSQSPQIDWPLGKYRLLARSYIASRPGGFPSTLNEGTEILYDRKPGSNLEPLDDGARKAVAIRDGAEKPTFKGAVPPPPPPGPPPGPPVIEDDKAKKSSKKKDD